MDTSEPASTFWNRRYEAVERLWSPDPNSFLVELAAGLTPGRALDLGAGEGRNAVWLAGCGWRVTALDVSRVALARAAERAAGDGVDLDLVEADWREYRPAPSSFDLVVISFMHPEPDARTAMFEWAGQALAAGGHLFVVGVDLVDQGRRGPPDPDRLYTPERLRRALQAFDVSRCESVAYESERDEERRRVTDVLAIARRGDAARVVPAAISPNSGSLDVMPDAQCPVCKTAIPPTDEQSTECPACDAKLERDEGEAWVLAGDAPAG